MFEFVEGHFGEWGHRVSIVVARFDPGAFFGIDLGLARDFVPAFGGWGETQGFGEW